MAGPCSVESERQLLAVAHAVKEAAKYCLKPISLLSATKPRDLFGIIDPNALYIDPQTILHVSRTVKNRRLTRMTGAWTKALKTVRAKTPTIPTPFDEPDHGHSSNAIPF